MHAQKTTNRMLATVLALAATVGIATAAQASDDGAPRYDDVVVTYSDLNLDTPAGNQKLYARLEHAAAKACGNEPASRDIERKAEFRACVESTLNRAVDKISTGDQRAVSESSHKHSVG